MKFVSKTKLVKYFSVFDRFHFTSKDKSKKFNKSFLDYSKKEISFRNIEFIDVCEIDNLKKVERQILRIIDKNNSYTLFSSGKKLPASKVSEIKENLQNFRMQYGRASQGKLFSIKNDKPSHHNDLYENVYFSYFKTFENLFVLRLEVKPSKIFHKYLEEIISSKTVPKDKIIVSHFRDFLRTRTVFAGYKTAGNQKEEAFEHLIYDLNQQLKKSFLNGFNGLFSKKKIRNPYISYFNSKYELDKNDFRKGFGILDTSHNSDIYYDQKFCYYVITPSTYSKNQVGLKVLAENDSFPEERDEMKSIYKYSFSNTIIRSWSVINYLQKVHNDLNLLRKTVYSFINSNSKLKFRKQIRIRVNLSKEKIKLKRIKNEFSKKIAKWYITDSEYETRNLCAINDNWSNSFNYFDFAKSSVKYFVKDSETQICELDDYFNEISSINNVKLNYRFQLIAVGLTILGLILALASAENIVKLIKSIIK
ncbi:MAG: hypothetical protein HN778_20205 [Prolixibacteraceae bacterium]|nr:hypothetical protein [Prolixibacteraceae bacterium]MBT7000785.1 hypothetical protein [Prolixibacteraceae bacterium]MBT7397159.1 hypothetical protein [Prolixibacteraceae bacterium]